MTWFKRGVFTVLAKVHFQVASSNRLEGFCAGVIQLARVEVTDFTARDLLLNLVFEPFHRNSRVERRRREVANHTNHDRLKFFAVRVCVTGVRCRVTVVTATRSKDQHQRHNGCNNSLGALHFFNCHMLCLHSGLNELTGVWCPYSQCTFALCLTHPTGRCDSAKTLLTRNLYILGQKLITCSRKRTVLQGSALVMQSQPIITG